MKLFHRCLALVGLASISDLTPLLAAELSCRQVPLSSSLPIASRLPALTFCGPAQETNSGEASSAFPLEDVVAQSPSVQRYELQLKSSEYGLKSAQGSWWPSVSMSNSSVLFTDILNSQNYGGTPSTPSSPSTAGTSINPFNGSTLRDGQRRQASNQLTGFTESYTNYIQAYPVIQIQWNFLDPSRYPQIAAAKHQLALSKSQLLQATQQARTAILLAYGEYLFAGFQIAEITRLTEVQQQIVDQANRRVQLKLLPRLEADQQFRNLLSYQSQLQTIKVQQANASVQLESLLRPLIASDGEELTVLSSSFSPLSLHELLAPSLQPWPWNREETVSRSLTHSESLKQLQLQSAIQTDNANEQWGAILPTIGVLGYVTYQYTAGSQNYAPPTQPSGAASSTLSNYAGLSISWNLFDGYATRNQAKSYEQTAAAYKAQFLEAATQLKAQTLAGLNEIDGNQRLISISLGDLAKAEQISEDTKARQEVGLAEIYDVLSAEMDVYQSRLQLIQSLATYVKSYAKLKGLADPET